MVAPGAESFFVVLEEKFLSKTSTRQQPFQYCDRDLGEIRLSMKHGREEGTYTPEGESNFRRRSDRACLFASTLAILLS